MLLIFLLSLSLINVLSTKNSIDNTLLKKVNSALKQPMQHNKQKHNPKIKQLITYSIQTNGNPKLIHPMNNKLVKENFKLFALNVSQLEKNGYNQPLYEAGCPIDWRLWVSLFVRNKQLSLSIINNTSNNKDDINKLINVVGDTLNDQTSVLSMAIIKKYDMIVTELLNKQFIDVNIRGFQTYNKKQYGKGKTPLFVAVESGHLKSIKLLLKHSEIDVSQIINIKKGYKNMTAIELAVKYKSKYLVNIIQDDMCEFIGKAKFSEKKKREQFMKHIPFPTKCEAYQRVPYFDQLKIKNGKSSPFWVILSVIGVISGIGLLIYILCRSKPTSEKSKESNQSERPSKS